jgi:hypothetical protein
VISLDLTKTDARKWLVHYVVTGVNVSFVDSSSFFFVSLVSVVAKLALDFKCIVYKLVKVDCSNLNQTKNTDTSSGITKNDGGYDPWRKVPQQLKANRNLNLVLSNFGNGGKLLTSFSFFLFFSRARFPGELQRPVV